MVSLLSAYLTYIGGAKHKRKRGSGVDMYVGQLHRTTHVRGSIGVDYSATYYNKSQGLMEDGKSQPNVFFRKIDEMNVYAKKKSLLNYTYSKCTYNANKRTFNKKKRKEKNTPPDTFCGIYHPPPNSFIYTPSSPYTQPPASHSYPSASHPSYSYLYPSHHDSSPSSSTYPLPSQTHDVPQRQTPSHPQRP